VLLLFVLADPYFSSSYHPEQIISKLREGGGSQHTAGKKVIQVKGANNNITHSMNDDERSEFTAHINSVLAGDLHIGDRIPIPTHTMQVFDECRGKKLLLLCSPLLVIN
jgi:plastin-1